MGASAVVFSVEKFATKDGPGIRTVVFVKGCPLRCVWCHSPESWSYEVQTFRDGEVCGVRRTADDVLAEVLRDKDFYDASGGGLTLSGGEPLAHPAFAAELLAKARAAGVRTAVETSGHAPRGVVETLLPHVDVWLWDVKHLDDARHRELTGRGNRQILENLRVVDAALAADRAGGRAVTLRCPMIPGLNDSPAELAALGRLADSLASVTGVDVEPYVPYGRDKARRLGLTVYEAPQPPPEYGPALAARLARLTRKPVRVP